MTFGASYASEIVGSIIRPLTGPYPWKVGLRFDIGMATNSTGVFTFAELALFGSSVAEAEPRDSGRDKP